MMHSKSFGLIAVLAAWAAPATAVEPLSAGQLRTYCEAVETTPTSPASQLCVAYVGGFLDGAVATDVRVAENVADEFDRTETFTERAARTRVLGRMERYGPSVYAEFCVGQPVPIGEVVRHVIDELSSRHTLDGVQAQKIVYAALRRHYPCTG